MKLGLCLSGGGVKGAAHIGVLKAFEEEGIAFDYISGTSSGSIVATLYAIGYNSEEIYYLFKKYCTKIKYVELNKILKGITGLIFKRKIIIDGLNSGNQIEKIINEACSKKNIENINQIKKYLIIPTVNLYNGEIYFFCSKKNRGEFLDKIKYIYDINIGKAVHASCSYPGVFSPCKYKNIKFVDGGLRENIPWKATKISGADKVISVVFQKEEKEKDYNNVIDVVSSSIDILSHELSTYELAGADYLLNIKTKDVGLLDINKIDYLFNMGYKITKNKIKEIKKLF